MSEFSYKLLTEDFTGNQSVLFNWRLRMFGNYTVTKYAKNVLL